MAAEVDSIDENIEESSPVTNGANEDIEVTNMGDDESVVETLEAYPGQLVEDTEDANLNEVEVDFSTILRVQLDSVINQSRKNRELWEKFHASPP